MKCPDCAKNQSVIVKNKKYCANCGYSFGLVADTAPRPKPPAAPRRASNLLDLTKKERGAPPAQSMHGVRKPTSGSSNSPRRIKHPGHGRPERARAIERVSKVSKFAPSPIPKPHRPSTPMSPHRQYHLNQTLSKQQLLAAAHSAHRPTAGHIRRVRRTSLFALKANLAKLKNRPRLVPALGVGLTVLILAGYISYLNLPTIAVKVAAARVGIDGRMPRYQPPGYKYSGPISYNDQKKQITIRFVSNSDNRFLSITQAKKDWDSATLAQVIKQDYPNAYPNIINGLTIWVYDGNKASWLNNGNLYVIEGTSLLSAEQTLKIAESL